MKCEDCHLGGSATQTNDGEEPHLCRKTCKWGDFSGKKKNQYKKSPILIIWKNGWKPETGFEFEEEKTNWFRYSEEWKKKVRFEQETEEKEGESEKRSEAEAPGVTKGLVGAEVEEIRIGDKTKKIISSIQGEEDYVCGEFDAKGVPMEAFNLNEERDMGHFADDGNFGPA